MLTSEQKAEMAELRKKGYSYQDIADRFAVSKTRVHIILNPEAYERHKADLRRYYNERKRVATATDHERNK